MLIGVTGGSGFVGKRLVESLAADGHTVRVLSRRVQCSANDSIQHFLTDLIDPSSAVLKAYVNNLDIIFHCAGEIRDQNKMEMLHVHGTRKLVEAARGSIGRWVQLSSVGAYGNIQNGIIDETQPEFPNNVYEITKTKADHIIIEASNSGAFQSLLIRPSAIIGLEMPNQSLFDLLKAIRQGYFFFIGPAGATRNYIHINDVIRALMLAGFQPMPKSQIFNLSNCCTIEELVDWTCQTFHRSNRFIRMPEFLAKFIAHLFTPVAGFPLTPSRVKALTGRAIFRMDAINQELGYSHSISIQSAIIEMANHLNKEFV